MVNEILATGNGSTITCGGCTHTVSLRVSWTLDLIVKKLAAEWGIIIGITLG